MFWDSSAIVPLLVQEESSATVRASLAADHEVTIWWSTPIECRSALHRRHREGHLSTHGLELALGRLAIFVEDADTVSPVDAVLQRAGRLLSTHPLRAADALQLAAALIWCEEKPAGETMLCFDHRLREAAQREGFTLLPPSGLAAPDDTAAGAPLKKARKRAKSATRPKPARARR